MKKNSQQRKYRQGRQGDVLITRVEEVPAGLKPQKPENGRVVLAHGEATGHHHSFCAKKKVKKHVQPETQATLVEVADALAELQHQEHATHRVPKGRYEVRRQREYSPQRIERVAD